MKRIIGDARVSSREQPEDHQAQALEQQIARLLKAGATEIFVEVKSGSKDEKNNWLRQSIFSRASRRP